MKQISGSARAEDNQWLASVGENGVKVELRKFSASAIHGEAALDKDAATEY